ncbi:zinc-ribbon domain-containing protein [Caloramator sp. mosi_1]|uniref:zinc-ribbon domain-containing protein n=1 Tax=Caloramator sp. mosi_1 TaxID=3023090 RepID=UPI00235E108E|nr:zinc-ribbon domain-containing protein [Caloramator sp. mosi_1]WDC84641.1 zinc-ribbon domain-containing protein [Caloramator sp. mosi_1]
MFFIGIFGVEGKEEHIGDLNGRVCKVCGQYTTYRVYKRYSYFHFFFIKLFRFDEHYYAISRCCNRIFEIQKEVGRKFELKEIYDIDDNDLKEIYNPYAEKVCPNCKN